MTHALPTAKDLQKLTLRAIVAYAVRTTRRLCAELREKIGHELFDDSLRLISAVTTANRIQDIDGPSVILAAGRIFEAYASLPESEKSAQRFLMVISVVHSAEVAVFARLAVRHPNRARHWTENAAQEAEWVSRYMQIICGGMAQTLIEDACKDYEILLQEYGQHSEVVIGDPVVCFKD